MIFPRPQAQHSIIIDEQQFDRWSDELVNLAVSLQMSATQAKAAAANTWKSKGADSSAAMEYGSAFSAIEQSMNAYDCILEAQGACPQFTIWWRLRKLVAQVPEKDEGAENGHVRAKADWDAIVTILDRYPRS